MSDYLSHISEDKREQSVFDHLNGSARLCGEFASHFGARELGILAGMSHDIGKYSKEFQNRLKANVKKVDHSTAGALECLKLGQLHAAYAVLGHHSGLPDGGVCDEHSGSTFFGRINRGTDGRICDYSQWKNEIRLPAASVPTYLNKNPLDDIFFIRMLYSCLVDADFIDTAEFMQGEPYSENAYSDMAELNRRLDSYISDWFPPKNELNEKRCAILTECMERGKTETSDLLTLTVPTGGGKTVASLAFALKRAMQPDSPKRRVIYVIPYTSIIEQTADVFRKILGDENVLEHHSGVLYDSGDELDKDSIRFSRAVENWDAPIVVTTAVQFFESLFANRSSKCRKLHNIADSIVIFDEAQMLPFPYLRPCIHAVSQLIAHYGVTAVLCTATQPVLEPFFAEYLPNITPVELCPTELQKDDVFGRVSFHIAGKMSYVSLAAELNEHSQVLCIVNSRSAAREIYDLLDSGGKFHLSTLMTADDRRKILSEIRERLKCNLPCRVVSTSLIEAGVDVDFPSVYREEAGLDSILQAAGRCNREGKRKRSESIVTVFKPEKRPPRLFAQAIDAAQVVLRNYSDLSSAEAIHQYFEFYNRLKGDDAVDSHRILEQLEKNNVPIKTVAEQFKLIESNTRSIYIPVGEGRELIEKYRYGEISKKLMRRLGQYSVSVYEDHFKALFDAGDIEAVGEDVFVLSNMELYDSKTGLSLTADTGKGEFI
ncbi:MAG: CRISPR-associated helicase Cas3' [Eubacteriales bacterium]